MQTATVAEIAAHWLGSDWRFREVTLERWQDHG
jgi:hypothetical protein